MNAAANVRATKLANDNMKDARTSGNTLVSLNTMVGGFYARGTEWIRVDYAKASRKYAIVMKQAAGEVVHLENAGPKQTREALTAIILQINDNTPARYKF